MELATSLSELLAAMIRAWKGICATLLVFALLLGGYQTYRQISQIRAPENSAEEIEERFQTALEEYETKKKDLQESLESQEKSLASKEKYLENSILLQIDPYDKYITNIVFTFTDIDESAQLFRYPNTAANYLPQKIRSQYLELWRSMDLPKDIGLPRYAGIESKYLSEIVSVSSLDGELVSIEAVGTTPSETEELATALYNYFEVHREVISRSSAKHNFTLINKTTKNVIDENLNTSRENLETEIRNLKKSIEDTKESIEDLTEPEQDEGYSTATIIRSVIKYAVLGAAMGLFLGCLFVCCYWLFAGRVSNSFQLEQVVSAPFLGSLSIPSTWAARLSAAVMGERTWRDRGQAMAYIREQIKGSRPTDGKILLFSTLPEKTAGIGMEELKSTLSQDGYEVSAVMDATHNPAVVEAVHAHTAAVFVEMAGSSNITAIQSAAAQLKNKEVPVLGIITI